MKRDESILDKHIFIVVSDAAGKKYTVEIPKQDVSVYRVRKTISKIQTDENFLNGKMRHDEVINYFNIKGIFARAKFDFKVMYLNPVVRARMRDKTVSQALKIIYECVATYYRMRPEDLKSKSRLKRYVMFREMFAYIAKTRCDRATYWEIGEELGGMSHCTMLHHKNKIDGFVETGDEMVTHDISEIDRLISLRLIEEDKKVSKEIQVVNS
jgi:hypothetical protein